MPLDLNTLNLNESSSLQADSQSTVSQLQSSERNETISSLTVANFDEQHPECWFMIFEYSLQTQTKITSSKAKFGHLISRLSTSVLSKVIDKVKNADPVQPYEVLKAAIIANYCSSRSERIRTILERECLGDRKPSEFLNELYRMKGDINIGEDVMREIFTKRLPASIQPTLSIFHDHDLQSLAVMADRMIEVTPSASISAVSLSKTASCLPVVTQPSVSVNPDLVNQLLQDNRELKLQIRSLCDELKSLTSSLRGRSMSRSPSSHRGFNRSSSRSKQPSHKNCWYHYKYGANAKKCIEPCEFSSGNDQDGQ